MESCKDSRWSWVVLIGVHISYMLSYGFLQCIGVFYVDWQEDFEASAQAVGWSSAVSIGGFGLSGMVSSVISPYVSCRWQAFFGGLGASIALTCCMWVTHINELYIIMLLMGFGIGFVYTSCVIVLGYYFEKNLALATGIGLSGSGTGLLILAPLIRYLNDEYSWRGAMLIYAGILGNVCASTSLFRLSRAEMISMMGIRPDVKDIPLKNTKERNKIELEAGNIAVHPHEVGSPSRNSKRRPSVAQNVRRHSEAFVKSYTNVLSIRFVMICIVSSILSGFGYFTSLLYFVSNAISRGIPKSDAAFLLSIYGICGIIGRSSYGPIVDKKIISPFYLASLLIGVAGSSCLIGTLANSYVELTIFAIFLGFSLSVFYSVLPLVLRKVIGVNYFKKIYGILVIITDGTSLLTLPLMGYAYDVTGDYRVSFYAAGSAMMLSSIIIVMDHIWVELDRRRQRSVLISLVY